MGNLIEQAEKLAKTTSTPMIRTLINMLGVTVNVYTKTLDDNNEAYGVYSGGAISETPTEQRLLFTTMTFGVVDPESAGAFEGGYVYSLTDLMPGSIIAIKSRADSRTRKFRMDGKETLGFTRDIVNRYKILAIGGE